MITPSYRPSICHQSPDSHIHYNVIFIIIPKFRSFFEQLRDLASRIGGSTAGQVITLLQETKAGGIPWSRWGVSFLSVETLPIRQICHKDENDSPSIDWDKDLFQTIIPSKPPPIKNTLYGKILHQPEDDQ